MTVKAIVELQAQPGKRDELTRLLNELIADLGPGLKERGSLGSTLYEVLDDPDKLIEVSEWESAEARQAVMGDPAIGDAMAPLLQLLASPFTATVVRAY